MRNLPAYICFCVICLLAVGCSPLVEDDYADKDLFTDSGLAISVSNLADTAPLIVASIAEIATYSPGATIETKDISPKSVVDFAQTLIGTPYKFGSSDPKSGLDCSGFITYVFNHFDIAVPRSSKDFEKAGETVSKKAARPGDLILFTGTNHTERTIGHLGIVTFSSPDTLLFIHSTSGKLNSVTVTPLNDYYQARFVKIIRIFDENNQPAARR